MERVSESIYITDLIAVVGWDGALRYPQSRVVELDEYLSIKVPLIGVQKKRHLLKRLATIQAISRMKLRQLHSGHEVLNPSKNLVAGKLVKRHPSGERIATGRHARTKNHVGLISLERLEQLSEHFGRVLAVCVQHNDDVQPSLDRVLVTGFLIAAVSEVLSIAVDG